MLAVIVISYFDGKQDRYEICLAYEIISGNAKEKDFL